MATICPTILADNPHTYRQQLERVEKLTDRVQIDLADGIFASPPTIPVRNVHWPKSMAADIHLMYERPLEAVAHLLKARPNMIILHAESHHEEVEKSLMLIDRTPGIKRGLALLPETEPKDVAGWLKKADHCLIFAGRLGGFGGHADLKQTGKIEDILNINPNLEIGWDGGVDDSNAAKLAGVGIDVLNVGGFIQKSDNPADAYAILQQITSTPR